MANQTPPNAWFDAWKEFLEKSSTFWSQAAAVPQPPDPAQLWRQFLGMWSDCWSKTFTTQTTSSHVIAERDLASLAPDVM